MRFSPPLERGVLLRRYKRFLADVETPAGERLTLHCPNTGAMLGCDEAGSEAWYSTSGNPRRKYPHTLEVVVTSRGRIGVNTARANTLVRERLEAHGWCGMKRPVALRAEAPIPDEPGRFDFLLEQDGRRCYLEVKNVTLLGDKNLGLFPDTVSERALKHVRALERRCRSGERAALVFCAQHTGIERVSTADQIHPAYGDAVRAAALAGVELYGFGATIERDEIKLTRALPVEVG